MREEIESLSDHRYISFSIENRVLPLPRGRIHGLRWNLKKADMDLFQESITWSCSVGPSVEELENPNPGLWVDRVLREACDASTPRIYARKPRKSVHWWCDEVEIQRRLTIRARRRFYRIKRRGDEGETRAAHILYKRSED